jgi:hypothetical protein
MARAQTAQKRTTTAIKLTPIKLSALDLKYTSLEPTWAEDFEFEEPGPKSKNTYVSEMTRGLNWLNYACSGSEFRGFFEDYIKIKRPDTIKEDMALLKKVPDKHIVGTTARMARMAVQGFKFNEEHSAKIWQAIVDAFESSKGEHAANEAKAAAKEAAKVNAVPQPTIQERILNQVRDYVGEYVDPAIDEIVLSGETKIRAGLAGQGFGEPHLKKIIELVTPEFNEFKEALLVKQDKTLKDDNSEQLREGYSNLSIKTLKALIAYLDDICSTAQRLMAEKKAGRVRKKKPVDKHKAVAKFKHLMEFPELKLKGMNPVDCLTVTDVWVYNTKTKKLGVYRGQYTGCLGIKGNSWVGFGETSSVQKTLRKPATQLAEFQTLGKNQLKKWFEGIKSVEHRLNGRGNEFTVIMRSV